jgi:ATP-dependent HslUV protease ATP-binding subunit HslU
VGTRPRSPRGTDRGRAASCRRPCRGLERSISPAAGEKKGQPRGGARRLHTILEKVIEEVSFEGPDLSAKRVAIDGSYGRDKLGAVLQREDLSKFIL